MLWLGPPRICLKQAHIMRFHIKNDRILVRLLFPALCKILRFIVWWLLLNHRFIIFQNLVLKFPESRLPHFSRVLEEARNTFWVLGFDGQGGATPSLRQSLTLIHKIAADSHKIIFWFFWKRLFAGWEILKIINKLYRWFQISKRSGIWLNFNARDSERVFISRI